MQKSIIGIQKPIAVSSAQNSSKPPVVCGFGQFVNTDVKVYATLNKFGFRALKDYLHKYTIADRMFGFEKKRTENGIIFLPFCPIYKLPNTYKYEYFFVVAFNEIEVNYNIWTSDEKLIKKICKWIIQNKGFKREYLDAETYKEVDYGKPS